MDEATSRLATDDDCCVACCGVLSRPLLLECLHSGCQACLSTLVRPPERNCLTCPRCAVVTSLPAGGVPALPFDYSARHKNSSAGQAWSCLSCEECAEELQEEASARCEDCSVLLCNAHAVAHPISRATRGHRVSPILHMQISAPFCFDRGRHLERSFAAPKLLAGHSVCLWRYGPVSRWRWIIFFIFVDV